MISIDLILRGVRRSERPAIIKSTLRKKVKDMETKEKWFSGRRLPKLGPAETFCRYLVYTDREEVREMDYTMNPLAKKAADKKPHWEEPDGSNCRSKILYWREMPEPPEKTKRKGARR
uniref:DUF551 domain-containing protein n=1 Tax=Caudovirales sp. ctkvU4 TaxID=2826783 RepID=A0A8S5QQH5_9CAUD|nr:MAG TPA: hypothetical protein [Caudovirales sp. ctkvU4]